MGGLGGAECWASVDVLCRSTRLLFPQTKPLAGEAAPQGGGRQWAVCGWLPCVPCTHPPGLPASLGPCPGGSSGFGRPWPGLWGPWAWLAEPAETAAAGQARSGAGAGRGGCARSPFRGSCTRRPRCGNCAEGQAAAAAAPRAVCEAGRSGGHHRHGAAAHRVDHSACTDGCAASTASANAAGAAGRWYAGRGRRRRCVV